MWWLMIHMFKIKQHVENIFISKYHKNVDGFPHKIIIRDNKFVMQSQNRADIKFSMFGTPFTPSAA